MVTFITVDRKITEVEDVLRGRGEATLVTYKLRVFVARNPVPINLESEPNKAAVLTSLFDDPDWRVRLYALGFLEEMQTGSNDNPAKRLKDLATDDPHKAVRKVAGTLLKNRGMDVSKDLLLLENFESNNRKWIDSQGRYKFFYNDEFLFRSGEGACVKQVIKRPLELPGDFDIELESTWRSGAAAGEYGLLIGSDEKTFRHFGISGNGQATARSIKDNGSSADLIPWTAVSAIEKLGAAPNRLRVEARGDTWNYYVNDTYIGAITNTMKTNKYMIGLRVCEGQAVAFEQLKISKVPEH
jgi:hypothetical protein